MHFVGISLGVGCINYIAANNVAAMGANWSNSFVSVIHSLRMIISPF